MKCQADQTSKKRGDQVPAALSNFKWVCFSPCVVASVVLAGCVSKCLAHYINFWTSESLLAKFSHKVLISEVSLGLIDPSIREDAEEPISTAAKGETAAQLNLF